MMREVEVVVGGVGATGGVGDGVGGDAGEAVGGVGGEGVIGGGVGGVNKVSEREMVVDKASVVEALGKGMVVMRLAVVAVVGNGGSMGSGATECQQKGEQLCGIGVSRKEHDRARQRGSRLDSQFNMMYWPRMMCLAKRVVNL